MQAPKLLRLGTRFGQSRSYASRDIFPATTMNDLPSPRGNWQKAYDQNQQKYNRHLLIGIISLGGTLAFGQYCGFHRMYDDIPDTPAVIASYKVEE
ncbi:hypothetical protein BDFB_005629 [Asbolus verrucosus]|uniref:Deltamethrin resistance protein prag01 domain-containing protein n=1 Tax=Asbolus verrucosus TaxID=1661398 RepID=A0A482W2L6_ASBVE|nr:hypothetical protein BDFB_005629 [Asbolus verrucosus]